MEQEHAQVTQESSHDLLSASFVPRMMEESGRFGLLLTTIADRAPGCRSLAVPGTISPLAVAGSTRGDRIHQPIAVRVIVQEQANRISNSELRASMMYLQKKVAE